MERSDGDENESCASQQNTMWKQFQARAKPLLSPKLGARDPEDKKERGMWMFKKMKRKENVVLDRVISSSQPDLLFSSQVDVEAKEAHLCGKAAGSGSGLGREKLQSSSKYKTSSPNKPTVAQLVQSHHKSSSLGSACLEKLAEPPGSSGGGKQTGDNGAFAAWRTCRVPLSREQPCVSTCTDLRSGVTETESASELLHSAASRHQCVSYESRERDS
ncbi:uncharacterized protein LOC111664720 [Seriola lalandi dorsalis]|uniref:uncharacterized protein LOC111664720 n=1 Tax=Seriola lalandi dorsalis TaxID=1841481 RepID=UPI000C6F67C5|nr:uncharacterized protein LOC111664720 [Seriola lalandi dorsalis]